MRVKTKGGVAEPMPLSDLQENNLIFRKMIKWGIILGYLFFFYLVMMTIYIIRYNVVNNIVSTCVR